MFWMYQQKQRAFQSSDWFVSSEKLTVVLMRRQLSRLFMNMPEITVP